MILSFFNQNTRFVCIDYIQSVLIDSIKYDSSYNYNQLQNCEILQLVTKIRITCFITESTSEILLFLFVYRNPCFLRRFEALLASLCHTMFMFLVNRLGCQFFLLNLGGCIPHIFWDRLDVISRKRFVLGFYINMLFCKLETICAWGENYGFFIYRLEQKMIFAQLQLLYIVFLFKL